jgi:Alanine dehydrogenase/PNT, N-terminal domain
MVSLLAVRPDARLRSPSSLLVAVAVAAGVIVLATTPPPCGAYQQATTSSATFRKPAPASLSGPFVPQSFAARAPSPQQQQWRRLPTARRATIDIETPAIPPLEDDEGWTEGSRFLGTPVPYNELTVGVLKERYPGENRVSQTPDSVALLVKAGLSVVVETGGACVALMYAGDSMTAGPHTCFFPFIQPANGPSSPTARTRRRGRPSSSRSSCTPWPTL